MQQPTAGAPAAPGETVERYTIRRKVFKIFGAGFHIYDAEGVVVGYCAQKAFRLREDLRVYTDESRSRELLRIGTQQVIDFGATYSVTGGDGEPLGGFRRRGFKSFVRDAWEALGPTGEPIGTIHEDSTVKALLRRANELLAAIIPQRFYMNDLSGEPVAVYRTHFNPFIHRLGVTVHRDEPPFDDRLILAAGCLLAAIEGRQD